MKQPTFTELKQLDSHKDLIEAGRLWCVDGWELPGQPEPEQIAAALLMEARTQELFVKAGESHPDYPSELRNIAMDILRSQHNSLDTYGT